MTDLEQVAKATTGDALALANFAGLGVFEKDGILYLPTSIKQRNAAGGVTVACDALLVTPTTTQRYRARSQARVMGKKFDLDPALDREQIDEMENYCLLAYCIRDKQTRTQLEESAESLMKRFHDASLKEVWARLNHWCDLTDPRYGELSNEQLWQVIAAVASEGNLTPLVSMPGFEQATSIVFMARAACTSPSAPSWLRSPTKSDSEPSQPTSSRNASETSSQSPEEPVVFREATPEELANF
jgi:hypothetical protein